MKNRVVELFAGVGGFRVGLNHIESFDEKTGRAIENGNWDFVWANQWEPGKKVQHAFDCYSTRFGASQNHVNQDISTIDKSTIPDHDLLVGGFPCQDYSVARSVSKEQGINGKKGVLWWQIRDILDTKTPPFVLLENVDRLLKSPASQRGRDFAIMLRSMNNLGYIVEWRMINAAEYGMPQRRRRVFIFAYHNSTKLAKSVIKKNDVENYLLKESILNKNFPISDEIKPMTKDLSVYDDEVDITNNYSNGKFLNTGIMINNQVTNFDIKEITEETFTLGEVVKMSSPYHKNYDEYLITSNLDKWKASKGSKSITRVTSEGFEYKYSEGTMSFPDSLKKPGRTMLTSENTLNRSSHIIDSGNSKYPYRKITEVEAECLNMFPPNWTNSGMPKNARYFMMGNALVTGIVSRLESSINSLCNEKST